MTIKPVNQHYYFCVYSVFLKRIIKMFITTAIMVFFLMNSMNDEQVNIPVLVSIVALCSILTIYWGIRVVKHLPNYLRNWRNTAITFDENSLLGYSTAFNPEKKVGKYDTKMVQLEKKSKYVKLTLKVRDREERNVLLQDKTIEYMISFEDAVLFEKHLTYKWKAKFHTAGEDVLFWER